MLMKNSPMKSAQNRQLHSGCGESLQSSLRDELVDSAGKISTCSGSHDRSRMSDINTSQILGGKENNSEK